MPASRRPSRTTPAPAGPLRAELLFLPGLDQVVRAELAAAGLGPVHNVAGRDDSVWLDLPGDWRPLLALTTVVAPYAVLTFAVPRPKSLVSGEHLRRITRIVAQLDPPPASFRFAAAGRDSPGFRQLAAALAAATGLACDQDRGELVLRFRRSVHDPAGWDVLVRLCRKPLSDRPWRVRDVPGAANATVASAMARLTLPRRGDRVVNLMCGSGTLLIERLRLAAARTAVGVDNDPEMIRACAANLRAAGLHASVHLFLQDIADPRWTEAGPFDVILADPPWGDLLGDHAGNEELHLELLRRAHDAAAPGARLVVLTHEIRLMERCLRATARLWTPASQTRVFHKGHHPRVYLLRRA